VRNAHAVAITHRRSLRRCLSHRPSRRARRGDRDRIDGAAGACPAQR